MLKLNADTPKIRQVIPDYLFGQRGICTYCGDIANSIDHVIAVSYFDESIKRNGTLNSKGVRTYSCRDCNCLLGSKYFETFRERCEYVNKRIEQRFKKVLNLPPWSPEEFAKLGKNIKASLGEKLNLKGVVLEKLRWQSTKEFHEYCQEARDYFKTEAQIVSKEWMLEYFTPGETIRIHSQVQG